MTAWFDVGLALMALGLAWRAIATRRAFDSTVAFVIYGLVLTIAWVRLGAYDVALTEAAVGSGLTGALLLGAAHRLERAPADEDRPSAPLRALLAVACAGVALGLGAVVLALPQVEPLQAVAAASAAEATGLLNPVNNVLMAFRAIDTVLEKMVLFAALVGVWSLAPDAAWGRRPGRRFPPAAEGPLTLFARVLPPVGVLIAAHLLWVGADAPGGAFQGATILAAMILLVRLAGLADAPPVSSRALRLLIVLGPAAFLGVGMAGVVLAGAPFAYPAAHAKAIILVVEFAMLVSVAATLALLVVGPPERAQAAP
ncbi:MAG: DUF4040 domain-containing protein [Rhodobacteraceae bacterium]|nr:MAG: DUF4040 domain-containing protein [Paracoccaceae bacterium]